MGVETNTGDLTGEIVNRYTGSIDIDIDECSKILQSFIGVQEQTPPIFSAIHIDGKRAYEYARQNKEVVIPTRQVEITKIVLDKIEKNKLSFAVTCGSGTYIRSLARDIGKKMGVYAHLSGLRRISSGVFNVINAKLIDEIEMNDAKPIDGFLSFAQKIQLSKEQYKLFFKRKYFFRATTIPDGFERHILEF